MRQLRAAHADRDVLGAEARHAEQVLLEARDLLAAFHVAERRGVAAALVEQLGVRHDRFVGLPELIRRRVIDPAAAKRDHLRRVEPHREDVLPLRHLHDLADRRGAVDLFAHERRKRGAGQRFSWRERIIPTRSAVRRSLEVQPVQPCGTAVEPSKMRMFDSLRQDVTGAIRGLIKSPGFAAASLITLALGIGATSAIFSVVKAVLITPLPYAAAGTHACRSSRAGSAFEKTWLADQEVVDFRNMSKTMTAIAAWNTGQQNLTGDGEPIRIGVGFVTANTLRRARRPAAARPRRSPTQEDVPNGPQVAVLGYPLWQARYGGDPNVIGRTLMINDVPVEVIGVMPEGFRLPTDFNDDAAEPTQLWRPIAVGHDAAQSQSRLLRASRRSRPGRRAAIGDRGAARDDARG